MFDRSEIKHTHAHTHTHTHKEMGCAHVIGMSVKRDNFFQNMRTITWRNMRHKYEEIRREMVRF